MPPEVVVCQVALQHMLHHSQFQFRDEKIRTTDTPRNVLHHYYMFYNGSFTTELVKQPICSIVCYERYRSIFHNPAVHLIGENCRSTAESNGAVFAVLLDGLWIAIPPFKRAKPRSFLHSPEFTHRGILQQAAP